MRILHLCPLHTHRPSGLLSVVPKHIAHQDAREGIEAALLNTANSTDTLAYHMTFQVKELARALDWLEGDAGDCLAVIHGPFPQNHLWIWPIFYARRIPYVVVPHGSLQKTALQQSTWKKRIAYLASARGMLNHAALVHFLTEGERTKSGHFQSPTFVQPNGVDLHPFTAPAGLEQGLRLIYIGRIDLRHKGLDLLIEGIAKLDAEELRKSKTTLRVFGSGSNTDTNALKAAIEQADLTHVVSMEGPISPDTRSRVLSRSDVFVHTSRFEGVPTAVLEALERGTPVMISSETNMGDLVTEHDAGWVLPSNTSDEIAALIRVIQQSPELISAKGLNGRRLIEDSFTWDQVTDRTLTAYHDAATHP